MMEIIQAIILASWEILLDSAVFMLIGILIAGGLNSFLSTGFIARHLGRGRYLSVFKAAFLGVPLPL